MAVRYGIPVSEFLARHSSAEITELYAFFALVNEKEPPKPAHREDPQKQAQLIKQRLFKGR